MLSVRIVSSCAGGGHLQVEITEDGAKPRVVPMTRDELLALVVTQENHDLMVKMTLGYYLSKGTILPTIDGKDIVLDAPAEKK